MAGPATSEPAARTHALVGEVIDGRYRVDEMIGRGGMGIVYRGEHVSIRRPVAIKVLPAMLAAVPEMRGRFEREAMAIGKIDHPNCVAVYDTGRLADGGLYLVMEFIEGELLGDLLHARGALSSATVIDILRHMLRGLDHVHAAGVVHRDIKPENVIIVSHAGDPNFAKILDFGIAKLIGSSDDSVKLTQAGIAFGTPIYMAPEQALGNPVDGRADVYAVAVLGYEMLTGRPPFYSDDKIELMAMHTGRPVPPMRERQAVGASSIPSGLEAVILRGLAKRPSERWPSALEFLAALDGLTLSSAIEAHLRPDVTGSQPLVGSGLALLTGTDAQTSSAFVAAGPAVTQPPSADVRLRRPMWQYLLAALAVTGIGVGIAVVTSGGRDEDDAATPLARKAERELERGNPAGAIRLLEAAGEALTSDAQAMLQLGHAYAAQRKNDKALLAYDRVVALAPSLETEPRLRANLEAMLADDSPATLVAFRFLVEKTSDPSAKQKLAAAAQDPLKFDRRALIRPLVDELGVADQIDWYAVAAADLEQGPKCEVRREAVARLRALGDARAVPVLEAAVLRKGKTKEWRGKLVNQCLTDDAQAAIEYLRALPAAGPS